MATPTIPIDPGVLQHYHLRDEADVVGFLHEHPAVANLLSPLHSEIDRTFKGHALGIDLVLNHNYDDEPSPVEMFALVQCDLEPMAALDMLDEFDRNWWAGPGAALDVPLHVDVEYADNPRFI